MGDYQYIAKVIGRKRDAGGIPIGRYYPNPMLDTSVYEVEFQDGSISDYAKNIVTKAIINVTTDGSNMPVSQLAANHLTVRNFSIHIEMIGRPVR